MKSKIIEYQKHKDEVSVVLYTPIYQGKRNKVVSSIKLAKEHLPFIYQALKEYLGEI